MKKILFLLLIHGVASASSFSGFFVSGGGGGDWFRLVQRSQNTAQQSAYQEQATTGNGVRGFGQMGWMWSCTCVHLGGRLGYHAFLDDIASFPQGEHQQGWKRQGLFFDILPGIQLGPCWLLHGIFGFGYNEYHFRALSGGVLIRDQSRWDLFPRVGAGLQRSFCSRLAAGFEWTVPLPGNPIWRPDGTDERVRWCKFYGSQFAFTLNWYFCR